jgi:hypothetical protein
MKREGWTSLKGARRTDPDGRIRPDWRWRPNVSRRASFSVFEGDPEEPAHIEKVLRIEASVSAEVGIGK